MPKRKRTEIDEATYFLAYESSTAFRDPGVIFAKRVSEILGIGKDDLEALEEPNFLRPINLDRIDNERREYLLRDVVNLRGDPVALKRAALLARVFRKAREAAKKRNRESKAPPMPSSGPGG
jgi:hypothetical protein